MIAVDPHHSGARLSSRPASDHRPPGRLRRIPLLVGAAIVLGLGLPTVAAAAVQTFGSSLSVPATTDTASGLSYKGTDIAVPPTREVPSGNVHISHDGADTAVWNSALANGAPVAPASGQITSVRLEGCAQPAQGGPAPLTQIHFQDLSPQGGGAKVNVTTQAFDIPVCGQSGASGSTVTTYAPTNFCVSQGDFVAFNDEGGFNSSYYPSGVPYLVLGAVRGSTADSFIRNNGTNNGASFSPTDTTNHDGFASNPNQELMLQATLATLDDATPLCPGGTAGRRQQQQQHPQQPPAPPVVLRAQRDGVNHRGGVAPAIFCNPKSGCAGTMRLATLGGRRITSRAFAVRGHTTSHVRLTVAQATIHALRRSNFHLPLMLEVVLRDGATFRQAITLTR